MVTIRHGTKGRLNLNTGGETDNWWEANRWQEKLIRTISRLINRTGVVDDDREIQEVTRQVGAECQNKTENTWHNKNTRSTCQNKHNRHVTARVP